VLANRARMERMKAIIVRTSTLASSAKIGEVKGRRFMCIMNDGVISCYTIEVRCCKVLI
jgi:hypothetical protein